MSNTYAEYKIDGEIVVKKNRYRAGVTRAGKPFLYRDPKYAKWEKDAIEQLFLQRTAKGEGEITDDVGVTIVIYRGSNRKVDLSNAIQGVEDALQGARIIANDNQIRSLDGSAVYYKKDGHGRGPHVCIVIEQLGG